MAKAKSKIGVRLSYVGKKLYCYLSYKKKTNRFKYYIQDYEDLEREKKHVINCIRYLEMKAEFDNKGLSSAVENLGLALTKSYSWIDQASIKSSKAISKSVFHQMAMGYVSSRSYIDRSLLSLYTENGVMRCNTKGGIPPFTGAETINNFSQSGQLTSSQIGVDPATAKLIKEIAVIITTAITAALAIKNQTDINSAIQTYAIPDFGPQSGDWSVDQIIQENLGVSATSLGLGLAAAVAAFIYFNKNEEEE